MKTFFGVFVFCIIISLIFTFLFAGFLVEHIYISAIVLAFLAALMITAFINQTTRIEALEEKMEKLSNSQEDSET